MLIFVQILLISIYLHSGNTLTEPVPFGKRATLYPGSAPLQHILAGEVAGEHVGKIQMQDADWDAMTPTEDDLHFETIKERQLESGRGTTQRSGKMLVAGRNVRTSLYLDTNKD